jgi:hypothetical protein
MNDLSLLEFRSTYEFAIVDMSYNIQLLTGFYSRDAYPIESESIEEQISDDPVYLESISFEDLTVIISRESALIPHPTPLDADYQISYTSVEPAIAIVNPYGVVTGMAEGSTLIVIEVRQKETPVTSAADFISNARITVLEGTEGQINSVSLPDSVDIWVGDIEMINPIIDPPNITNYTYTWTSEDETILGTYGNRVVGISEGSVQLTLTVTQSNLPEITATTIVHVIAIATTRIINQIVPKAVGMVHSTPMFYLLCNVGAAFLSNDYQNPLMIRGSGIAMTISNASSPQFPLISQQAEVQFQVMTSSLSDLHFSLVDANYIEIHLLNPMYLSISIEALDDEDILSLISNVNASTKEGENQGQT